MKSHIPSMNCEQRGQMHHHLGAYLLVRGAMGGAEGRIKDMIICGGENIYPGEIEAVLFDHPAVAEAAVIGLPDQQRGEVVAAFIRLAAPGQAAPDSEELRAYCRGRLAPYKTPVCWEFVDTFP